MKDEGFYVVIVALLILIFGVLWSNYQITKQNQQDIQEFRRVLMPWLEPQPVAEGSPDGQFLWEPDHGVAVETEPLSSPGVEEVQGDR